MKRRVLSVLLSVCLCLALLPAGALAAATHTVRVVLNVDYSAAYEELEQLNQLRRAAGVPELVMDKYMMDMAVRRAAETTLSFSHARPNGERFSTARPSMFDDTAMGENILRGGMIIGASTATDQWNNSPGHQANMLNGTYRSVGIACVRTMSGWTYWVQNFTSATATPESTPTSGTKTLRFQVEIADSYLDVNLNQSNISLNPGQNEMVYLQNGETPVEPDVMQSSDERVATLRMENSGGVRVTAVGPGTATVTLGVAGRTVTLLVDVAGGTSSVPPSTPTLTPTPTPTATEQPSPAPSGTLERFGLDILQGESLYVGDSIQVNAVFTPPEAAVDKLSWTIDNPDVIAISPHGTSCTLTALSSGIAQLYVTTGMINGQEFIAVRDVVVLTGENPNPTPTPAPTPTPTPTPSPTPTPTPTPNDDTTPTDVDLSATYLELVDGEQVRLIAYVRPNSADQQVTWASQDTSVASVDQNGRVTGRQNGTTRITATSRDGSCSATCQVVVNDGFGGKPIYFPDVKEGDYCYDAAAWATSQNLEVGFIGEPLGVARPCTRMELVRYLWKLMGSPQPSDLDNNPFTDVSDLPSNRDDRWAVQWAVETGVTTGTSPTTFSPNMTVTRAQVVTFLHRAAGLPAVSGSTGFSDVASGDWFADAAVWAVKQGITNGTGNRTFTPNRECSRGEILTFLYRQFG